MASRQILGRENLYAFDRTVFGFNDALYDGSRGDNCGGHCGGNHDGNHDGNRGGIRFIFGYW